jgi:hypothetical protein
LFAVLAFPGLFGLAGLFVGPLDQLGIGGPAVNADGCLGAELLFDLAGELAVLAELLGLALGVDDLPLGWVHPVLGELAANRPDILEDFSQCVPEGVDSTLSAFEDNLDLGMVSTLSVHRKLLLLVAGLSPRLVLTFRYGGNEVAMDDKLHLTQSAVALLTDQVHEALSISEVSEKEGLSRVARCASRLFLGDGMGSITQAGIIDAIPAVDLGERSVLIPGCGEWAAPGEPLQLVIPRQSDFDTLLVWHTTSSQSVSRPQKWHM